MVGFGIYELQRIDQAGDRISALNDKVNELPGKIGTDLRDITKTLADVVSGTSATGTHTANSTTGIYTTSSANAIYIASSATGAYDASL